MIDPSDGDGSTLHECPYCDDGVLEDEEGLGAVKICSNEGSCPVTFVAVLDGGV